MKASDILIVGSKYRVAAFRKSDGGQVWETELVTGFFKFGGSFVTLAVDDDSIYAYVCGQLFRLNIMTGNILWHVKAPSLGRDVASIALCGNAVSSTSTAFARIDAQRKSSGGDAGASAGDGGGGH